MARKRHRRRRRKEQIPPPFRRELEERIAEARAELERWGVDVLAIERLIVPAVRFTESAARLDLPEPPPSLLTSLLGRRYFLLDEPVTQPSVEEIQAEMNQLVSTGHREHLMEIAHVTLFQRRMSEQGRDPARERERPVWEAARVLGVALAVLADPTPTALTGARACFEALDRAHPTGESWAERRQMRQDAEEAAREATLAKQRRTFSKHGRDGGKLKSGKLIPHNELIRRALVYDADRVNAGDPHWLTGPVRRATLNDVLRILEEEDLCQELIHTRPGLPLSGVEVNSDAGEVDFLYAARYRTPRKHVRFQTLENFISKLCRHSK